MQKIIKFLNDLVTDRGKGKNSKIFVGLIFSVVMIIGLFVSVDSALYQTFTFATLALFGISAVDNLTAPKITIDKKETSTKETKTEIDVGKMTDKITKVIKKKK